MRVPFLNVKTSYNQAHNREATWNTENWEKMEWKFPRLDLDAWACPLPTDQGMTRNRSVFCTAIWNSAATSSIQPKSTAHTRTRSWLAVSSGKLIAIKWWSPPSLVFASVPVERGWLT